MRAGRAFAPRVVAGAGETQHPAHRGHRKLGLIGGHEPESFPGILSVSRANQAAAFAKRHLQVHRFVAPGCLQLQRHLPGGAALQAFVGQPLASDVAAQLPIWTPPLWQAVPDRAVCSQKGSCTNYPSVRGCERLRLSLASNRDFGAGAQPASRRKRHVRCIGAACIADPGRTSLAAHVTSARYSVPRCRTSPACAPERTGGSRCARSCPGTCPARR